MKTAWMAMTAGLAGAAILAGAPAMAALSGFHDSAAQIAVITTSTPVADAMKQLPIEGLKATGRRGDGGIEWRVWSKGCSIKVVLTPVAPQGLGRTDYRVGELTRCR